MSIESDIRDIAGGIQNLISRSAASFSPEVVRYILPAVDAVTILLSCLAAVIGYDLSIGNYMLVGNPFEILPSCAVGSLASLIYILRMNGNGYYGLLRSAKPRLELREILVCWFTTGLLLALIAFLLKISSAYSRGAFVIFYILAPVALLAARKAAKVALAQAIAQGAIGRGSTVLIGEANEMAMLQSGDLLALCGALEVRRFTLSQEDDELARSSKDARIVIAAANFVRRHNCQQVLIALPWSDGARIEFIRDRVKTLPVAVRLAPDKSVRALADLTWSAQTHAPTIELQREPLSGTQRLVKRIADVVVASLVLIFLLPVMALIGIAIKLDSPGPVIFRQTRKGFNGKHFVILKFRTMTVQENGPKVVQATRGDSRVTAIGRLLRSTSIDELPQLWNVLRGDMSLIGPRPHALAHDSYFETLLRDYAFRHHVKPGITGWAQCNGARGATPTIEHIAERVKLDRWYIDNWSLSLDLLILIRTVFEVLRKRNAY
ncbi:undecaprenyl-phosphate glucose phosphotransferase [Bradyrhizobium sp.]|uniref:undecaprenyl-phosphate glucose phosphotransferase n=1 Tax=Bradyrhizobium sp. TaxID=376 RepID=UPI003C247659